MGLLDIFKKKNNLAEYLTLTGKVVVNGYRAMAKANNSSPSLKMSDQKILEIYQQVGSAFRKVAHERGEILPAGHLNSIIYQFYQIYEMTGQDFYYDHLKYEIDKYIREGLRQDYKRDLNLF